MHVLLTCWLSSNLKSVGQLVFFLTMQGTLFFLKLYIKNNSLELLMALKSFWINIIFLFNHWWCCFVMSLQG